MRPSRRAWRSMARNGTTPLPPPTSSAGVVPSHTNQPPIGPRTSSWSPGCDGVGQVRGDLAVVEPLDEELDLRVAGCGGQRVRALRPVAVLGGQPDDVVLPGQVLDPVGDVEAQLHRPRGGVPHRHHGAPSATLRWGPRAASRAQSPW